MNPDAHTSDLFPDFSPVPQMVFVNDSVSLQTEADQRVILVHGVVYSHYSREDRMAEAYALVSLYESGYADQNDLGRSFGYSTRTLRRLQQRLHSGGLNALVRPEGRPADGSIPKPTSRDRTILRLKAQGISNRGIAGRLGLDEKMIRKILLRLGWQPAPEATFPLLPQADAPAQPVTISDSTADRSSLPAAPPLPPQREEPGLKPAAQSFDANPLDRSMDRLWAALGLLDDALPLFATAQNLPRAGVLLAIPALVASGLLSAAEKIYGSLRPSFYGLRTTLVAYVLLALLRIPRPETLKEYSPGELGRIVGPHAGSQDLAPQAVPAGGTPRQPGTRSGDRAAAHPRTWPRVRLPLRRWSCSRLSWQTHDSQSLYHSSATGCPGDHRLLGKR